MCGKYVKFLTKIRESQGLNMNQMALKLNITPQTYHYYEKTAKGMNVDLLVKIKKIFGLSWSKLGKMLEDEID